MKQKIYIILIAVIITSCSGFRQFEKRDNYGRITRLENYQGQFLESEEIYTYYGHSHNPSKILYKAVRNGSLVPVREEIYTFKGNNLVKLDFYKYSDEEKTLTGQIHYIYRKDLLSRVEYFKLEKKINKLLLIVQDRYSYQNRTLKKRRFIEYTFNPATRQPMQVGQYVIIYKNKKPVTMKSWVLENKKVISKTLSKSEKISKKINTLENNYLVKTKGKTFKKQ